MPSVKFLFYAMLAYLLVQATLSLAKIMLGQDGLRAGPQRSPRSRRDASGASRRPNRHPRGDRERENREHERATRLREDEDIEDATWEDL